jgi:cytochrome c-type biogenesis protein CcmH
MSERATNLTVLVVSVVALAVIVVGLWPQSSGSTDPAARAYALETRIKCPICAGESLAGSQAEVARDLRAYIATRIAAGATDQEIVDEFVANYGEQILLDPPRTGWGLWLWLVPVAIGAAGVFAVFRLRRRSGERSRVASTAGGSEGGDR